MILNSMAGPADGGMPGECLEPFRRGTRNLLWLTVREGRRFILKGLPEALRSHPEETARLRKEYSLGLRISHPGIAGVYGFETHPTALAKKAQAGDISAMTEYASLLESAESLQKKLENASSSLSVAQATRLNKIAAKLAKAMM